MAVASHMKAAEHCANAAEAHKSAADLHGKGDHKGALKKADDAQCCCSSAKQASMDAHGKSAAAAKK